MPDAGRTRSREDIIAAAKIEHDARCSCDPKYLMSCGRMAAAILEQGKNAPASSDASPSVPTVR